MASVPIRTAAPAPDSRRPASCKRSDFGVDFNAVLETGGVVVADKVAIHLEIEAVLDA